MDQLAAQVADLRGAKPSMLDKYSKPKMESESFRGKLN
jgi:hypothetical protein